ncbi:MULTISPECIES: glycosyltransferase family 4 protein [Methanosarcina]|uniref:Glycosyl transferase GT4 family n=3 Tax=Methanosarcina barkeri TaxID=2208 RepID=A0A0G3CJ84_METBA|nr:MULTISPECIES: glycosyltransferase family 4 protein [Methanosarcina]AKB53543.1 putative glycosyltransferase [Methanosarcina barkeri MS]AKB58349.1 putative glycosyltransferase [Methanosarcina barkeri 227]AKJ39137.1 glycosyl transferase GT4 family [Methanosarcina barkeri CM1]OED02473.1 hexosyltransferase [Methanosarcina sp. A14]
MKLAFVTPWYGNIPGGAESECRRTVENLQKHGIEVEILTTCVKEFLSDWSTDFYEEGIYNLNGVSIHRFSVRKRDTARFDKINYKLMRGLEISPDEEKTFMREMVNSPGLYSYIAEHGTDYDYFLFIPYMFGTTYYGSCIYPEKSVIIPCLHDESYAYLNIYKTMFENVKGIIFHASPEKILANHLYNLNNMQTVLGEGIDMDFVYNPDRFREKYGIKTDFILYAGRKEAGKNVPLLIDFFTRYKKHRKNELKLVLIGSGTIEIPSESRNDIIDLGFVPLQDKYDAYAAATFLCQPSLNESFSIVIMESWLCKSPVLVHGNCAVTKDHCIKCNGGLYFNDYYEFEGCLDFYLGNPAIRKIMAENGMSYVIDNFSWDKIVEKYIDFLGSF